MGVTAQALPFLTPLTLIKCQVTTIDGHVVHPLTDGIAIAGTNLTAVAPPITFRAENGTTTGVQVFQGSARDLKSNMPEKLLAVGMVPMAVLGMVHPTNFLLVQG